MPQNVLGFFIFKDKDALFKAKKALGRVLFFKDRDVFNLGQGEVVSLFLRRKRKE